MTLELLESVSLDGCCVVSRVMFLLFDFCYLYLYIVHVYSILFQFINRQGCELLRTRGLPESPLCSYNLSPLPPWYQRRSRGSPFM
jgi:hypothetical protein